MKTCHYAFYGSLLWLTACSTEPVASEQTKNQPASIAAPVTAPPINTVHQFLGWYKQHEEQLNTMPLVPAANDKDTVNIYAIDFAVVESYLHQLQSSGSLSPAFLLTQRDYFKHCQDSLQTRLQTDGPPFGLDYDRILYTQDAESQVQLLLRSRPASVVVKGDTARVVYHWQESEMSEGPDLSFILARKQGQWLIIAIRPILSE
ncbi:hypothetical protein ACFQ48_11150 [Hymenobacter caeli]|uniref:DUF3828 domain-containing protein n=1 Tax=Hymenobacter caeli TaxID=2735894 RepID=A0ABX2FU12_9BACT|nr:hypothetical protein [Hymenobacter caeli]NRT19880.1 hypothetical protein [Hymenobacter caeli]